MTTPEPASPSGRSRPASQVLWSLAPSVYIPSLLEFSGLAALMPVIPLLALDLGFSAWQAAALTTIFGLTSFLGPIPAGHLISRVGARSALVVTGCLLVVANVIAFVVLTPAVHDGAAPVHRVALVVLLLVMATNTQVWQLGRQAYLGTALPPMMRARGMTLFGGVIRIGQVIGPLLGAVVMATGSDTGVFLLFAVTAAAATVMIAVFLPPGEAQLGPARPRGRRPARSPARRTLNRAVLARMAVVGLGITPVMMARVNRPVIVPLLGAALGLDSVWISIVFGLSAVLEILLVIPAGTLMDRHGRAAVAVPCAVLMGAGYLLLAILGTAWSEQGQSLALLALLLPSLLIGIGNGLGSGIVMTLGIDVSPVHDRTRYLAWWNTMLGAGRLAAPLVVTGVALFAPITVAGAAMGGLCLVGGAWLARVLPRVTPSGGTRAR
ncbi:MAG: MFS transporter [Brachybacterium sp.]|uniref:MFS transporter n=1 Tax=Brachybacterium sp. TaxID=1891286 RepID=UPI00264932C9|nr:MFS transporter [Brachybacterium sp.]MDN5687180.1 MFS transporter [Brachybacterium sp.]